MPIRRAGSCPGVNNGAQVIDDRAVRALQLSQNGIFTGRERHGNDDLVDGWDAELAKSAHTSDGVTPEDRAKESAKQGEATAMLSDEGCNSISRNRKGREGLAIFGFCGVARRSTRSLYARHRSPLSSETL